jgi:hypothetical protein
MITSAAMIAVAEARPGSLLTERDDVAPTAAEGGAGATGAEGGEIRVTGLPGQG